MGITEELKVAGYGTTPKCDDIVAGAGEGRQEVEIIEGGAEKGHTGVPEEATRKDTRDMLTTGEGLGQEKREEVAEDTAGEEAEVDREVGPGKEVREGTREAEADKGIGLGKEAAQGTSDKQGGNPEKAMMSLQ